MEIGGREHCEAQSPLFSSLLDTHLTRTHTDTLRRWEKTEPLYHPSPLRCQAHPIPILSPNFLSLLLFCSLDPMLDSGQRHLLKGQKESWEGYLYLQPRLSPLSGGHVLVGSWATPRSPRQNLHTPRESATCKRSRWWSGTKISDSPSPCLQWGCWLDRIVQTLSLVFNYFHSSSSSSLYPT